MATYLIKRILLFIPVLLLVSVLSFWLSELAPGDRVVDHCGEGLEDEAYHSCARLYFLDRPAFYASLQPRAYPDTLYRYVRPYARKRVQALAAHTGTWEPVAAYDESLKQLQVPLDALSDSLDAQLLIDLRRAYGNLLTAGDPARIAGEITAMRSALEGLPPRPELAGALDQLDRNLRAMTVVDHNWGMYIPRLVWHGTDNRYHRWLRAFLRLDFGTSFRDSQPVARKMGHALFWTLLLNGLAYFFALLIAVPLGVRAAMYPGGRFDRVSGIVLFMLYSLPRFWVATILVVFFTTSYYGAWLDWFPSIGLGEVSADAGYWERFTTRAGHLILPVFCLTYSLLAFISRQMRGGMLETIRKDYIRTARAKGLPENKVIWRHAFRNALFPIITILGALIPATVAGSVIIEVIFAIPGMGRLMYDSVFTNDWPVLFTGLMLGAVLTLLGILVADILYALADPRVRLQGKSTSA